MSARSLHKLTTKGNSEMPDDKVRIPGLPPIPVVSDAEAENSDFLVCAPLILDRLRTLETRGAR
jgi:hypothetical protein